MRWSERIATKKMYEWSFVELTLSAGKFSMTFSLWTLTRNGRESFFSSLNGSFSIFSSTFLKKPLLAHFVTFSAFLEKHNKQNKLSQNALITKLLKESKKSHSKLIKHFFSLCLSSSCCNNNNGNITKAAHRKWFTWKSFI